MEKDSVVIVTGGSQGLGKAIAKRFAAAGVVTYILSRSKVKLESVRDEFGKENLNVFPIVCDVTDENSVKSVVSTIVEKHGRIDVLINNAGTGVRRNVEDTATEDFDRTIATNVRGVFLMTKYVVPVMKWKKDGFIVNISSMSGIRGVPGLSAYCASKFAIHGFSESIAEELKLHGIRVTAFFPGSINTHIHVELGKDYDESTLQQMMQPEDVAETIFTTVDTPKRYWISMVQSRAFLLSR